MYLVPSNGDLSEGEVVFSRSGEQTDGTTWLEERICTTRVTPSFRVAIEAIRGPDYQGDIAIDDIQDLGTFSINQI